MPAAGAAVAVPLACKPFAEAVAVGGDVGHGHAGVPVPGGIRVQVVQAALEGCLCLCRYAEAESLELAGVVGAEFACAELGRAAPQPGTAAPGR